MSGTTVDELIARYELEPHPEGGWYRRTWVHPREAGGRPMASSVVYLLAAGDRAAWHRIDAHEQWHHYAGDDVELLVSTDGEHIERFVLGGGLEVGHPQRVVPPDAWQSAHPLDGEHGFAFVGCTVTPGFTFDGHELAPDGWQPGDPIGPPAWRVSGS